MKIRLIVVLFLAASTAMAQDFEGTIKWSIKMNYTDPKVKAQVEEAERQIKDPANQARMKEAMDRMNSPEMKKMMDSNPQLKAQMETMMKNMRGGNSIAPTGISIKTKNGNVTSTVEGGIVNGLETIYIKAKNESYLINRDSKTYSLVPEQSSTTATTVLHEPTTAINKTSETQKILGYTCTKTIVTITEADGTTVNQIFWVTKDIRGLDFKSFANQKIGSTKSASYYKNLEGIPLKTEMTTAQGTMIMEATEIKKQTLPASDFEIPAGFTKTNFMGQ